MLYLPDAAAERLRRGFSRHYAPLYFAPLHESNSLRLMPLSISPRSYVFFSPLIDAVACLQHFAARPLFTIVIDAAYMRLRERREPPARGKTLRCARERNIAREREAQ